MTPEEEVAIKAGLAGMPLLDLMHGLAELKLEGKLSDSQCTGVISAYIRMRQSKHTAKTISMASKLLEEVTAESKR